MGFCLEGCLAAAEQDCNHSGIFLVRWDGNRGRDQVLLESYEVVVSID